MKRIAKNRLAAGLLTAACVSSLLTGCGEKVEETIASEVIPVEVQMPQAGTLRVQNEFIGTVSPEEAVYVMPLVSAEVLSTNVKVGDTVQAGDVLCRLDSEGAELQLASAEAQYASAEAGLNTAQAGYNSAVAQYESAAAQADAQVGGSKKLQDYQADINIDKIKDGLDDIDENLTDLEEDKDDAKKARKKADENLDDAKKAMAQAQAAYDEAKAKKDSVSDGDSAEYKSQIDASYEAAKKNLTAAQAEVESAAKKYAEKTATYDALKDSIEDLEDTRHDTQESLEQAETIKKITDEDVYGDTQNIVDKSKAAAATGIDSAQAQVESAKVGMSAAQVGIDSAQYQVDMYTLTAPISGVIEAVNVEDHGFASSGNPAFVISNKNTMTITFHVSEGIRNTFQIGQQIQVDRSGKIYDAAITEIGTMLDASSGLFQVKASVDDVDGGLLTGSTVKIIADTYAQEDALLIPYDAVYYDDSQSYVYVAENGKAVRKNIETGIFNETTITVLSGLTAQDQLIVSWSSNLRDGADVSLKDAESKEQSSATKEAQTEEAETEAAQTAETETQPQDSEAQTEGAE